MFIFIGLLIVTALLVFGIMTRASNNNVVIPKDDAGNQIVQFPEVVGSNLLGKSFQLPADFEAPLNIVLIAYNQQQQNDVFTWVDWLDDIETRYNDVRYYELPAVPDNGPIYQAQLDYWMYTGIPENTTRARTITLYLDVALFNQAIGVEDSSALQLLLLTPKGDILWQASGGYTDQLASDLEAIISQFGDE